MPLIKSKSPKAFSKNVETEMNSGKPQPQSLAVAYSVKRKAKKKLAEGGEVNAKGEKRPMPENEYNDSKTIGKNSGNKPPMQDQWTDNPTVKRQSQRLSTTPLSQPKIVGSDAFSVRNRGMRDDENDFGDSIYPETDKAQPIERDNEIGPNRQGNKVPDMERQHKAKKSAYDFELEHDDDMEQADESFKKVQSPPGRYAKGGTVGGSGKGGGASTSTTGNKTKTGGSNPGGASTGGAGTVTVTTRDMGDKGINISNVGGKTDSKNHGGMDPGDEDDDGQTMMYDGGPVMEPEDHGQESEERDDEAVMRSELNPGERKYSPAKWRDEFGANRPGVDTPDLHMKMMAKGGAVQEEEIEHAASIAAAIMARRKFAEGGQVDIEENNEEQPNGYYNRNEDAALKENYDEDFQDMHQPEESNEHGDSEEMDEENEHDSSIVDKIRRKKAIKSPITR